MDWTLILICILFFRKELEIMDKDDMISVKAGFVVFFRICTVYTMNMRLSFDRMCFFQ